MKNLFLLFVCVNINASYLDYIYQDTKPSYNSFGQAGLIQTPSAATKGEGYLSFTWNQNEIWKLGTLSVTPFDWMEASYFYYRPQDLFWASNNSQGDYLDKGFNVKFLYKSENSYIPDIALGLDDFAGTGYFTREYIVATNRIYNMNVSLGMGWGMFATEDSYENPLKLISEKFSIRPLESTKKAEGGTPSYDMWFRGDAALFGGIEFYVPRAKGLKIKLEYDPFDYVNFTAFNRDDANKELRSKESNINLGVSYPINNFTSVDLSFFKGNTFNISFHFGYGFAEDKIKKHKFKPKITLSKSNDKNKSNTFYKDLLRNLNNNNLFLQSANIHKEKLDISISTSEIRNPIRSSSRAASIANLIASGHKYDFSRINIAHINAGIEQNNISFLSKHLDSQSKTPIELVQEYTKIESGSNLSKNHAFRPRVNFPSYFSSTKPIILSHIGRPDRFYYGGLALQNFSEIQFSRNLILTSELNYAIYNKFNDGLESRPDTAMEPVRTELVRYLQESDLYISRMQLDYIWSPKKEVYTRLSAGIFESMYGGIGLEALYAPFNKNYSIGMESFYVKKRGFDQKLKFLDYKTTTGHLNFYYQLPKGIQAKLTYGRYLAKDDGFTLDVSKISRSGFQSGFYFTRTDVPAEIFGEGSFDKGFYFQIPLELFSKNYSGKYTSFKLSPLTRDGGAKLQFGNDLRGLIGNSSLHKFHDNWDGFLD
jgi:hypothetical protein